MVLAVMEINHIIHQSTSDVGAPSATFVQARRIVGSQVRPIGLSIHIVYQTAELNLGQLLHRHLASSCEIGLGIGSNSNGSLIDI